MKRKFLFLRENAQLSMDSVIYVVMIGEGVLERQRKSLIEDYCKLSGAQLHQWDEWVDEFISYEEERIFGECSILNFGLKRAQVTAEQLLRIIVEKTFESFEGALCEPEGFYHVLRSQRPWVFSSRRRPAKIQTFPYPLRKNLSESLEEAAPLLAFS